MPFTSTGYSVRRFRDIQEDIRSSLEADLGTPVTASPDSVLGITNSVFSSQVANVENNLQAFVANLSIFTAEGTYLDEIVSYIGLSRRGESPANGSLKVWRSNEGNAPSAVLFSTPQGEQYTCPNGVLHSLDTCAEVLLTPITVTTGVVYTVTVNTIVFSYTALVSDTATDVVDYFTSQITSQLGITATNESDSLKIIGEDENLNSLTIVIDNFTLIEIASFSYCESVFVGDLTVIENTITQIVTNNPSLLRSNNPLPFQPGQDTETDEELRARHQRSVQVGGNATVPAIIAKLLQVNGVTQAFIVENRTFITDGDGRPPKSYESIVVGGDPTLIGQQIWDTKPAGVETTGNITTSITDAAGDLQAVKWSRPENIYIFIRVTYQKYDEESFPTNAEAAMADALLEFGNSLSVGNDIISTRFVGGLYRAISGLDTVLVEIGSSTDIGDTAPVGGYSINTIPINTTQIGVFTESRISFVETV